MTRLSRALVVLCIFAAAFLFAEGAAARPPRRAMRPFDTKFHSLSQACHGVSEDMCPNGQGHRTDCLAYNFNKVATHECKLWLSWRTTCFAYATVRLIPDGKCHFTGEEPTSQDLRDCLRTADMSEAPAACTQSPYYKSLLLRSPRRMSSEEEADL